MQVPPPPQAPTQPSIALHVGLAMQVWRSLQQLVRWATHVSHWEALEGTPHGPVEASSALLASSPLTPPLLLLAPPLLPVPPPPPTQSLPWHPSTGGRDEEEEQAKTRSAAAVAHAAPRALRVRISHQLSASCD